MCRSEFVRLEVFWGCSGLRTRLYYTLDGIATVLQRHKQPRSLAGIVYMYEPVNISQDYPTSIATCGTARPRSFADERQPAQA